MPPDITSEPSRIGEAVFAFTPKRHAHATTLRDIYAWRLRHYRHYSAAVFAATPPLRHARHADDTRYADYD
jgi:hypothetical protein